MADEKKTPKHGKKFDQKMKPYLVYHYLMRNSDASHTISAEDIRKHLKICGISAERRSIYSDIEEINKALLLTTTDKYGIEVADTIEEAAEMVKDDANKTIIYDEHRKGYYVRKRHYKVDDIRLLAECVYSAKFIDEKRAKRLTHIVCDLVSEHHAETIKSDTFLADRVKTEDTDLYETVRTINAAMSKTKGKEVHIPQKIKFKYLKYTIQGGVKRVERRRGEWYIVSPYKLLISDGFYYLIGFDDKTKKIRHYRIDRMKDVALMEEKREGAEAFRELNIDSYLRENISMYGGQTERVVIRAMNHLLDTFVDKFGAHEATYMTDGDDYFKVSIQVSISKTLYGWLSGFGNQVKIVSPDWVAIDFKEHLKKMLRLYDYL